MSTIAATNHAPKNTGSSLADIGGILIRVRHRVRRTAAQQDRIWSEARQLRRAASGLRNTGNPFDRTRIAELEKQADQLGEQSRKLSDAMRKYGHFMMDFADVIDAYSTLDQRCDLLNVNVADRKALSPDDGVVKIVFAHGLEDSAENRRAPWKNGPLFRAAELVFFEFLMTNEGRAVGETLFQPGGLFEAVPTYSASPDGTMTRNRPKLRVVGSSDQPSNEGV
jgi:hypothetical protein